MLCAYCFPTNGEPFLWGVKTLATRLLWADLVPCGVAVNGEALPRGVPRGVNIFCFVIPDIFFKNVISFCFSAKFEAGVACDVEKKNLGQ